MSELNSTETCSDHPKVPGLTPDYYSKVQVLQTPQMSSYQTNNPLLDPLEGLEHKRTHYCG